MKDAPKRRFLSLIFLVSYISKSLLIMYITLILTFLVGKEYGYAPYLVSTHELYLYCFKPYKKNGKWSNSLITDTFEFMNQTLTLTNYTHLLEFVSHFVLSLEQCLLRSKAVPQSTLQLSHLEPSCLCKDHNKQQYHLLINEQTLPSCPHTFHIKVLGRS